MGDGGALRVQPRSKGAPSRRPWLRVEEWQSVRAAFAAFVAFAAFAAFAAFVAFVAFAAFAAFVASLECREALLWRCPRSIDAAG
jgi:hypothetical protein